MPPLDQERIRKQSARLRRLAAAIVGDYARALPSIVPSLLSMGLSDRMKKRRIDWRLIVAMVILGSFAVFLGIRLLEAPGKGPSALADRSQPIQKTMVESRHKVDITQTGGQRRTIHSPSAAPGDSKRLSLSGHVIDATTEHPLGALLSIDEAQYPSNPIDGAFYVARHDPQQAVIVGCEGYESQQLDTAGEPRSGIVVALHYL